MAVRFSDALRQARALAIIAQIDAGTTGGKIDLYEGSIPTTAGGTPAGNKLGTLTLQTTSATAANGVITFNSITDDTAADASGTVGFARVSSTAATNAFVMDVQAGVGQAITMSDYVVVAGGVLKITSLVITEGNA